MTQDINLQRKQEVFYKMDPEWFNGSTLSDKSTNRRTAGANGGVVVNANSPYGGAAGFDDTDDYFTVTGENLGYTDSQAMFAIVKWDSVTDTGFDVTCGNDDGTNGVLLGVNHTVGIQFDLRDDTGTAQQCVYPDVDPDVWYSIIAQWDGEVMKLYVDGEAVDTQDVTTHNAGTNTFEIGRSTLDKWYMGGEIAAVGRWSRSLNEDEVEALSEMKGPMVQQL